MTENKGDAKFVAQSAMEQQQVSVASLSLSEDDLAKKRIKDQKAKEKALEKEAKKAKAAAKAAAMAAAAAQSNGAPSKKAAKKAALAAAAAAGAGSSGVSSSGQALDSDNPVTEPGRKKRLAPDMAKAFNPRAVEAWWYEWWEKCGFFNADNQSSKPPFVMVVPPPNVTGALHIGHALTAAVQDTLCRWRRMRGYNVCWVPGVDHAGIATQVVVEKKIARERGLTRHDLGRDAFVEEVWKWKQEYGDRIGQQQRKMGASLDWSRECFTMDAKLSKAVVAAFIQMYHKGLIYRDNRLVNWDCTLKTAISDIEVDYKELTGRTLLAVPGYSAPVEFGVITSFAYPLEGEAGGEVVVATTRPETMLGDTAIAVHPLDERYKGLHGKYALHPFQPRRIPIICDAQLVNMDFGTGAVKITPAHDPNDFATGKRHGLEFISVFNDDGTMNAAAGGEFEGLPRFTCRARLLERLKALGLYRGDADNAMSLGFCSRSHEVIEPLVKPQWYVSCREAAQESVQAVQDGRLRIVPDMHVATWHRWLTDARDWCISRQLWWGHRIPAWYAHLAGDDRADFGAYNDHWVVGGSLEEAEQEVAKKFPGVGVVSLTQDPDVLDTWFSSGLFPFSVFGWPHATADLAAFYPTSLLETGSDILFFWVARMVMMAITLTGQVPFREVLLHAMVRDAHGRKMSKSLGNVIDPLEVIHGVSLQALQDKLGQGNLDSREVETARAGQAKDFPNGIAECGCDALRFALVAYTAQSVNINLDIQRVVGYRLWCNKLWNAIRFAIINLGPNYTPPLPSPSPASSAPLPLGCRWILSVLNHAVATTNASLEAFQLADATSAVYAWWQYQLCDVFIETSKAALAPGGDAALAAATRDTLWTCLDTGLRLLHPFMPFVTEELWQRLHSTALAAAGGEREETKEEEEEEEDRRTIVLAQYPQPNAAWEDPAAESQMAQVEATVKAVRALRMAYNLQKQHKPVVFLQCFSEAVKQELQGGAQEIATLAAVSSVQVLDSSEEPPVGCAVAIVSDSVSVHLVLKGLMDVAAEILKLQKKKEETIKFREALAKKMQAAGYEEKVPAKVQEENASKAAKLAAEMANVEEALQNFQKLQTASSEY